MESTEFIQALGLIVVFAAGFVLVGRRIGVPPIASAMLAGLLLGPVLGLLDPDSAATAAATAGGPDTLALISEVGIVLLLFLVGLELSLEEIRDVGPVAAVAALGQSLLMAGLVAAVGLAAGLATSTTVILAIAMGFSSTVVVIKQLEGQQQLDRPFGRIAVGILLVQDLIVIIVLTVLAGLASAGGTGDAGAAGNAGPGGDAGIDAAGIAWSMARAFSLMALLLGVTLFCARFVLPRLFRVVGRSPASGLVWSLAWCFVLVEAAALMGLSVEIGAFLAGLGLSSIEHRHEIRRRVRPLMGFFIAVFFASLGSRIDFGDLSARWPLALGLTLLVVVVKPPAFMLLVRLMGHSWRTSFHSSITLMQISEFSLILGAAALAVPGLIDPADTGAISLLGVVALATILVSVLAMNGRETALRLAVRLVPASRRAAADSGDDPAVDDMAHAAAPRTGHVVVVGMNPLGRRLVVALAERDVLVVAVDTDSGKFAGLPAATVVGSIDHPETRAEASLESAGLAICALRTDEANRLFAHRCRRLDVPFVVHAFDRYMRDELETLGPAFILDPKAAADGRVEDLVTRLELVAGRTDSPSRERPRGEPC